MRRAGFFLCTQDMLQGASISISLQHQAFTAIEPVTPIFIQLVLSPHRMNRPKALDHHASDLRITTTLCEGTHHAQHLCCHIAALCSSCLQSHGLFMLVLAGTGVAQQ